MEIAASTTTHMANLVPRTMTVQQLAPREKQVLHLLSTGRPYKQIADELKLSMGTIRTYIRRLYGKLHVNCRTEAVVKYLTNTSSN
jgi:DNA-binding NarL/FixJ family response regulator